MKVIIIYEDSDLLICEKLPNIATETDKIGQMDMVSLVKNYLAEQSGVSNPYVGVVHRLDQPVHGVLAFAKTPLAAKELSRQITEHTMNKQYYAICCGQLYRNEDTLVDYLQKEPRNNVSKVVSPQTPGAKKAQLTYRHVETKEGLHLMEIDLLTGRHHQIRVQMAHAGLPLLGDLKYGNHTKESHVTEGKHLAEERYMTKESHVAKESHETDEKHMAEEKYVTKGNNADIKKIVTENTAYKIKADTVALCAHKLICRHPKTKKEMVFTGEPIMEEFLLFHHFS